MSEPKYEVLYLCLCKNLSDPICSTAAEKGGLMGSSDNLQHIINIAEEIKPARWPGCCIYDVPPSLREVNKEAYTPLLISIGPIHHGEKLRGMQEQKHRYFRFFRERLNYGSDLEGYETFLKGEEQRIRHCYQKEFPNIKEDGQFVIMILLDAVFIMELFLREVEARKGAHKDDYIITRPYLSTIIRRDLLLLENQLPIYVLHKLYEYVPCRAKNEKHDTFLSLAHEYFKGFHPDQKPSKERMSKPKGEEPRHFTDLVRCYYIPDGLSKPSKERMSEPKGEEQWHFTNLVRCYCIPDGLGNDNDMSHHLCCPTSSIGYGTVKCINMMIL